MKFVVRVKDESGQEVETNPIDQETVEKWIELGKIRPSTPIRNALMNNWKEAAELDFLAENFKRQEEKLGPEKAGLLGGGLLGSKKEKDKRTAFIYKYIPNPAPVRLRVAAFAYDCIVLGLVGIIFYGIGVMSIYSAGSAATQPADDSTDLGPIVTETTEEGKDTDSVKEEKAAPGEDVVLDGTLPERKDNREASRAPTQSDDQDRGYRRGSVWLNTTTNEQYSCLSGTSAGAVWVKVSVINTVFHDYFFWFMVIALLYYGISLGFFAQTFGMWFWGIFIGKTDEDVSEVFCLRAFAYAIAMFLFGVLTPIMVLVNPKKRSLHEILTGVQVIRISAKPRA